MPHAAIARVTVVDDENQQVSVGTGFLVTAGGLVLTAAHVVADRTKKELLEGTIHLEWNRSGAAHQTTVQRVTHVGYDDDWALLQCKDPPQISPLVLDVLGAGYQLNWVSAGYTSTDPLGGVPYDGYVRLASPGKLTLHCTQIAAGSRSVAGISGAPCIVFGRAVALIRVEPAIIDAAGEKKVVEATLYAVPIQVVTDACRGVLALEDRGKLPYEREFAAGLPQDRGMLLEVAETLAIESPEQFKEDLPRRVARAMIGGGLEATVHVIRNHRWSFSHSETLLVELAKTLWVYPQAADQLSKVVERPAKARAAALNATRTDVGDHYLRRAGYLKKAGYKGWMKDRVSAINKDGEPEEALRTEIGRLLADKLGCARNESAIREELVAWQRAGDGPVVVVVADAKTLPSHDFLEKLFKAFEGIVLVLLTGDPLPPGLPAEVDVIAPPIEPDQEGKLLEEHNRIERKLA